MKKVLLTLLVLIPFAGFAQLRHDDTNSVRLYLDSVLTSQDQLSYINPKNLQSVEVIKEQGAVYIRLKDGVTFLSPDEILDQYLGIKNDAAVLFIIGEKVLLDTSGVRIDSSFIKAVEQTSLAKATYLDEDFQEMKVVTIRLSPEGDKQELRIRGLAALDAE